MSAARRAARPLLVALALVLGLGVATACGAGADARSPSAAGALAANAQVVRVIDGDTIIVRIAGRTHTARLLGIDTPETVDPRRPVQCYGPEASARTAELLPPGTGVHLARDVAARDDFGRLLVYVRRASDGLFVNLELAASGHADALAIAPNQAHRTEIAAAVAAARAARRGLWGACGAPDVPLQPGESQAQPP